MTSVFTALRLQGNIFIALFSREADRRLRSPINSLLGVLEPLAVISVLATLWYFLGSRSHAPVGNSPVLFYATGLLPLYLFIAIANRGTRDWASSPRRFPVERRLDLYFVAIVLLLTDYLIVGILLFAMLFAYGVSDARPNDYNSIFEAISAIAMLGFGWGILQITIKAYFPVWGYLNTAFTRSLVLFSGIFFVPETLPPNIRYPMSFNPMMHAIELFKRGFYPNYAALTLNRTYLFECAVAFVLAGLILERVTRRSQDIPRKVAHK